MIATRLLRILAAVLIAPCHLRLPVTHTQVIGPVTGATRINRCWLYVVLVLVGLTPQSRSNAAPAEQIRNTETTAGRCVVIDSDAGLDDFRAIAVLAANQRVAAIVVTEGLSDPVEGSAAVEVLLARMGQKIPVIVGESPPADRKYIASAHLREWRNNAERLNGLLPTPEKPAPGAVEGPANITAALKRHVTDCSKITLLVIGPWTSFMRYAPELLDRIDRIVAQGRPDPDEIGGTPSGFNCVYDLNNCLAAFDLLVGRRQRADRYLRATWVDIPNDPTSCGSAEPGIDKDGKPLYAFRPTARWAATLAASGGPAEVIGEMLKKNPNGWEQTSLWDDLTALYILRPELFMTRGGHREPCVPSETVRRLLAEFLAKKPVQPAP